MAENTRSVPVRKQEKKIHPFLFLLILAAAVIGASVFWNDWRKKSEARRLDDIIQSQAITELITGEGFNKKAFSEDLENLRQAHKAERSLQGNLEDIVRSFADIPDFADDDVGLAMQGIQVSQGEDGLEEWRLFAKWATMRQKTGVLQVEDPVMWHRVGESSLLFDAAAREKVMHLQDDGGKIVLKALHGLVYDNNSKVLLQDTVSAEQNANSVHGPLLSYSSEERVAVFPENARFKGEGISGRADVLSWNMNANKIYGSGRVYVEWVPTKE